MSKYAFIMRGIPGSGKSTIAKMIAQGCFPGQANRDGSQRLTAAAIHSTDDLCIVDGEYQFDIALAGERHAQNLENFKTSLEEGIECVICDNTNVKFSQYSPYVRSAEAAGYRVVLVEMPHPAPILAASRSSHGVPISTINQMVLDWEPSQHCVTVDKVNRAYETVKVLQERFVTFALLALLLGLGAGVLLGFLLGLI